MPARWARRKSNGKYTRVLREGLRAGCGVAPSNLLNLTAVLKYIRQHLHSSNMPVFAPNNVTPCSILSRPLKSLYGWRDAADVTNIKCGLDSCSNDCGVVNSLKPFRSASGTAQLRLIAAGKLRRLLWCQLPFDVCGCARAGSESRRRSV